MVWALVCPIRPRSGSSRRSNAQAEAAARDLDATRRGWQAAIAAALRGELVRTTRLTADFAGPRRTFIASVVVGLLAALVVVAAVVGAGLGVRRSSELTWVGAGLVVLWAVTAGRRLWRLRSADARRRLVAEVVFDALREQGRIGRANPALSVWSRPAPDGVDVGLAGANELENDRFLTALDELSGPAGAAKRLLRVGPARSYLPVPSSLATARGSAALAAAWRRRFGWRAMVVETGSLRGTRALALARTPTSAAPAHQATWV